MATEEQKVQGSYWLEVELADRLRDYVHKNRTTKNAVISKALLAYLDGEAEVGILRKLNTEN